MCCAAIADQDVVDLLKVDVDVVVMVRVVPFGPLHLLLGASVLARRTLRYRHDRQRR